MKMPRASMLPIIYLRRITVSVILTAGISGYMYVYGPILATCYLCSDRNCMVFYFFKKTNQFPRCKHLVQMKDIHEGNRQLEIYKVPVYFFFHILS